jgi:putative transposase
MGLPRSTYYDAPPVKADDAAIVATITAICDEFEAYGYRRVGAELRHRGMIVNSKKIRRLMRENGLQPKRRRRFVATTDSDHDGPIFPDLARDSIIDGPNQLWVADITYIAITTGFVYLAAILDAWSPPSPSQCFAPATRSWLRWRATLWQNTIEYQAVETGRSSRWQPGA